MARYRKPTPDLIHRRRTLLRAVHRHYPEVEAAIRLYSGYVTQAADNPGQVAYATKPQYRFNNKRRKRISLSRFLSRRLHVEPNAAQCAAVVVAMAGYNEREWEIHDTDIQETYRRLSREAHSCMSSNPIGVQFYDSRPMIRLLVYQRRARALVWTREDGSNYIDRVYPSPPTVVSAYREYAAAHGWDMRRSQSLGDDSSAGEIRIDPPIDPDEPLPYIDTFKYLDPDDLTVLSTRPSRGNIKLNSTDGESLSGAGFAVCANCGDRYPEEDIIIVEQEAYCQDCAEDSGTCEACGDTLWLDDLNPVNGDLYCGHCYAERFFVCEECNEDAEIEEATEVEGTTLCTYCADHLATVCSGCQELFFDTTEFRDEYYCADCIDEVSAVCPGCGERFQSLTVLGADGDAVCAACGIEAAIETA